MHVFQFTYVLVVLDKLFLIIAKISRLPFDYNCFIGRFHGVWAH